MDWILPALFGFALGLASSYLILLVQRQWQAKADAVYTRNVVANLIVEIEEGIGRALEMVHQLDAGSVSMGRIYVDLWHTTSQRLAATLSDTEMLSLLHRIYYRFDLINFNCSVERPGPAAAFAKEYLEELEANLSKLKDMVAKAA